MPKVTPDAEINPAFLPLDIPMVKTYKTSGPGVIINIQDNAINNPKSLIPIIRSYILCYLKLSTTKAKPARRYTQLFIRFIVGLLFLQFLYGVFPITTKEHCLPFWS
jgi:hypothetical protein